MELRSGDSGNSMSTCALLLLAAASAAPGAPGDSAPASQQVAQPPTFEEQLEGAKRLYFQGERREALSLLSDLQTRYLLDSESVPWESAAEALVYLGEVHYFLDDLTRATNTWRILLERDPDFPPLSPFAHPPEIAGEFERLRGVIRAEIDARPVPEAPPIPAWTVLPLGLPQYIDGHPVRGVLYGVLQVGFAAGSLGLDRHLRTLNVSDEQHPRGWTFEEQTQRVNTLRYGVQWPMSGAFYGTWVISHLDARRSWVREHQVEADLAWTPSAHAPAHFTLSGRF